MDDRDNIQNTPGLYEEQYNIRLEERGGMLAELKEMLNEMTQIRGELRQKTVQLMRVLEEPVSINKDSSAALRESRESWEIEEVNSKIEDLYTKLKENAGEIENTRKVARNTITDKDLQNFRKDLRDGELRKIKKTIRRKIKKSEGSKVPKSFQRRVSKVESDLQEMQHKVGGSILSEDVAAVQHENALTEEQLEQIGEILELSEQIKKLAGQQEKAEHPSVPNSSDSIQQVIDDIIDTSFIKGVQEKLERHDLALKELLELGMVTANSEKIEIENVRANLEGQFNDSVEELKNEMLNTKETLGRLMEEQEKLKEAQVHLQPQSRTREEYRMDEILFRLKSQYETGAISRRTFEETRERMKRSITERHRRGIISEGVYLRLREKIENVLM